MVNSKLPRPTSDSTELEVLQFEHAELYGAFKQRGAENLELLKLLDKYQSAFGELDTIMQGVLK
jgi:hypothetical protein